MAASTTCRVLLPWCCAVETTELYKTAHWAHLPYDFLGHVSNRIINEINGISRVVMTSQSASRPQPSNGNSGVTLSADNAKLSKRL